jgi:uncharacterized SAM-binding protein YcdF (DUF218 family)
MKSKKKIAIWFLLIIISLGVGFFLFDKILVMNDSVLRKADVIIVLGYPANEDGSPSNVMIARVDKGIDLLRSEYAPRILFTGGDNPIEAQVMTAYAQKRGVPANLILQESESKDTKQNAEYSTRIMLANNWKSAIVVTSPYHMLRTSIIFSRYDLNFLFVKANLPEDLSLFVRIKDITHEIISFLGGAY